MEHDDQKLFLEEKVLDAWTQILEQADKGQNVDADIVDLETNLKIWSKQAFEDKLELRHEPYVEVRTARYIHDLNKNNHQLGQLKRSIYYNSMQSYHDRIVKESNETQTNLIKWLFVVHGATAIAAFSGLPDSSWHPYFAPLRDLIFFSVMGIALASIGQLFNLNYLSKLSDIWVNLVTPYFDTEEMHAAHDTSDELDSSWQYKIVYLMYYISGATFILNAVVGYIRLLHAGSTDRLFM